MLYTIRSVLHSHEPVLVEYSRLSAPALEHVLFRVIRQTAMLGQFRLGKLALQQIDSGMSVAEFCSFPHFVYSPMSSFPITQGGGGRKRKRRAPTGSQFSESHGNEKATNVTESWLNTEYNGLAKEVNSTANPELQTGSDANCNSGVIVAPSRCIPHSERS